MPADTAGLRRLAYDLLPAAWPGLSDDHRDDVIDTLAAHDYLLALEVLAETAADVDASLLSRARAALEDNPV